MQFRPGSLVVFEGLDAAGKSTQVELLQQRRWAGRSLVYVHMPSGFSQLTSDVYALTETRPIESVLARQLLHLACHAESLERLRSALTENAVLLDRWFWSTYAYGIGSGLLIDVEIEALRQMAFAIWRDVEADVVFLFQQPHDDDPANHPGVAAAYAELAEANADVTVPIASGTPAEVHERIVVTLRERGVLTE